MPIQPHQFSSSEEYYEALYDFMVRVEGYRTNPYLDTATPPKVTIGIGYNISDVAILREAVIKTMGFDIYLDSPALLTPREYEAEQYYYFALNQAVANSNLPLLHSLMEARHDDDRYDRYNIAEPGETPIWRGGIVTDRPTSFSIAGTEDIWNDIVVPIYEERVATQLDVDFGFSAEGIVAYSLVFGGLLARSPALREALENGNRADAWFEIRYLSNGSRNDPSSSYGIQNRRFEESSLFGLFNGNEPSDVPFGELIETVDHLTSRYLEISDLTFIGYQGGTFNYEADFFNSISGAFDIVKNFFIGSSLHAETFNFLNESGDLHAAIINKSNIVKLREEGSVHTGDGNDYIFGSDDNDGLSGGNDADRLYGFGGEDIIDGGSGNDLLSGGLGKDTYVFRRGFGQDEIIEHRGESIILDFTDFESGEIEISYGRISTNDNSSSVVFTTGLVLEEIRFSDRTITSEEFNTFIGTEYRDSLIGNGFNTIIRGLGGNDTINGMGGASEILDGGDGSDVINGHDGDDTLIAGGGGHDILEGGRGNDTYKLVNSIDEYNQLGNFNIVVIDGERNNYMNDPTSEDNGADTVDLSIVSTEDVNIYRSKDDIYIDEVNGKFNITLKNYYKPKNQIEELLFANETISLSNFSQSIEYRGGSGPIFTAGADIFEDTTGMPLNLQSLSGNDYISIQSQGSSIDLGEGDDYLSATAGNDILGGGGDDQIYVTGYYSSTSTETIDLGNGADVLDFSFSNGWVSPIIFGGAGDDFIRISSLSQSSFNISAGQGDDYIDFDVLDGDSTFYFEGDFGTDVIAIGGVIPNIEFLNINQSSLEFAKHGNDALIIYEDSSLRITNYYLLSVEDQRDLNFKVNGSNSMINNSLALAVDTVISDYKNIFHAEKNGGGGIVGTGGADRIYGYLGQDYLNGAGGDDYISGGNGSDALFGDDGNDIIFGGAGSDYIEAGEGDDLIEGGMDDDSIHSQNGDDEIYGGMGNDYVAAGDGSDDIYGGDGDDTLNGDNGNDIIHGESGNDYIQGGNGDDVLNGNEGSDILLGGSEDDLITGGAGDDLLLGDNGHDTLFGDDGIDTLVGRDGNDLMYGGADNDTLVGDSGADLLYGELGDDWLDGGSDDDLLVGGAGVDTYTFGLGYGVDSIVDNEGNSIIAFNQIEGDQINVTRSSDDLVFSVTDTTDALILKNYFVGFFDFEIGFGDGTSWSSSTTLAKLEGDNFNSNAPNDNVGHQVNALVSAIASFDPNNFSGSNYTQNLVDENQYMFAGSIN